MLINLAHAAEDVAMDVLPETAGAMPSTGDAFMANMVLILILVVMFYILLIRPQQKRFKEHTNMLQGLEKGAKIVTQGGLIGKIEKINDDGEVVLDIGNSQKVTVIRSAISSVYTTKPGNDNAKAKAAAAAAESKAPAKAKKSKTPKK
jgi:preprotein translocase subunit YajC|tara:strand:- start:1400 stop:1843 length:444 start_codon:yes stop_codon:yes gene_type:complete